MKTIKVKQGMLTDKMIDVDLEAFKERWLNQTNQFKSLCNGTCEEFDKQNSLYELLEETATKIIENEFNRLYRRQNKAA